MSCSTRGLVTSPIAKFFYITERLYTYLYIKQKPNTDPNPVDYLKYSVVYFTVNHIYINYLLQIFNPTCRRVDESKT